MFTVHVIQSEKTGRFYKGHTADLATRLNQHNRGKTFSTKHGCPWKLVYTETFQTREEAIVREKYFKSVEGGKALKSLVNSELASG